MLDLILVDRSVERCAIDCWVVSDGEWVLTSDHLPIVATIGPREATSAEWVLQGEVPHRKDMIALRKATSEDISMYQYHIELALDQALSDEDSPNSLSDRITNVLHSAAQSSLLHNKYNKYLTPYWTADVKQAHKVCGQKRRIWIAEGRPRGRTSVSYTNYKEAKSRFRKLQREESNTYMDNVYSDLDEAAGLDY